VDTNRQHEKNHREIIIFHYMEEASRGIEIMIAKVDNDSVQKEVEQSIRLQYTDARKVFKALKGMFE
jgi:hypothetical protein